MCGCGGGGGVEVEVQCLLVSAASAQDGNKEKISYLMYSSRMGSRALYKNTPYIRILKMKA